MLIDKLNKHATMKVIISTHAEALYGTKLNINMKKSNLIMAYQNLGAQPMGQTKAPNQGPHHNPQPQQHPNMTNWTICCPTGTSNKEVMHPFNRDALKLV